MKPIATSTSDFADLIKNGGIYVDKTAYFHRLVSNRTNNLLFLSRPRRFGKSLTITALKEIFSGNRELFEGLAISKTDWSWEKWPVIHFEFADVDTTSIESFEREFAFHVKGRLSKTDYVYDESISPAANFGMAIDSLSEANNGNGVVVLIDEYDAPVSHALDDIAKAEAIRSRMGSFFSMMKTRTGAIRFLLMTGVSKFTKMSVFSCLNNIVDISMDEEYATMLGYTEEELEENFEEHLCEHAIKMGLTYEDYRAEMKRWYNGFRFSLDCVTTVYNPISIALTLFKKRKEFSATWSSTGRASSLMNSLKRWDMLAIDPDKTQFVTEQELDVTNLADLKPIGMLYQTGYLTIKDYADGLYTLSVPDEEVRRDLNLLMTSVAAEKDVSWAASLGAKLRGGAFADFFLGLKSLYAAMAYGSTESTVHENSYARSLSFLLAGCGFRFSMEDVQANGRADVVARHVNGIYIFELKVGEGVDKAFKQIREKGYATPYLASGLPIYLIGLSFDPATRQLVDYAFLRE
ncbi:MAG: AAA family ATPase [Kiritimatiellae bacterium]|nr:AAA family ATPase [Kiritimatiellia bacterium]